MKEVTETNEKDTIHLRVWCLFMNCGEGQALCWAKPPAASPFSSGCRDLSLQKPTSSEKAVCAYQLPTLHFV